MHRFLEEASDAISLKRLCSLAGSFTCAGRASFLHLDDLGLAIPANSSAVDCVELKDSVEAGGEFYIAPHRILVLSERNTPVVWKSGQYHCTTLQGRDLMDTNPEFLNSGLALQFSARLTKAWKNHRKRKVTNKEAIDFIANVEGE